MDILRPHRLIQALTELCLDGRNHFGRHTTLQLANELLNGVSRHQPRENEIHRDSRPGGEEIDGQTSQQSCHAVVPFLVDAVARHSARQSACHTLVLTERASVFLSVIGELIVTGADR